MTRKMKRFMLTLDPDLSAQIHELAGKYQTSATLIIRALIDAGLSTGTFENRIYSHKETEYHRKAAIGRAAMKKRYGGTK